MPPLLFLVPPWVLRGHLRLLLVLLFVEVIIAILFVEVIVIVVFNEVIVTIIFTAAIIVKRDLLLKRASFFPFVFLPPK